MDINTLEDNLRILVERAGTASAGEVLEALRCLDAAVAEADDIDARLRHFLEKRSYAKALDYLRVSVESIRGGCR